MSPRGTETAVSGLLSQAVYFSPCCEDLWRQRKLWLLSRGQSQGDYRAFQGCHLTPGLPRLCPFSLCLLSLSLSVNFLHIIHSRPSAHKQFSQVLSLSSMLTLLTHCQQFYSGKLPLLRTTFILHHVFFPFALSSLACFSFSHLRQIFPPALFFSLFFICSTASLPFLFHFSLSSFFPASFSSPQQLSVVERPGSSM